jgi:hypothetical protein
MGINEMYQKIKTQLFFYSLLFCVFFGQASFGQVKLSDDATKFPNEVVTLLSTTKDEVALQFAQAFPTTFASFTPAEQKQMMATAIECQKSKKLRVYPDFANFFGTLALMKSKGIASHEIDTFLQITTQQVQDKNNKKVGDYLNLTRLLIEKNALFESKFNSLTFSGGSYSYGIVQNVEPAGDLNDLFSKQEEEPKQDEWAEDTQTPAESTDVFSSWDNVSEDSWSTVEDPAANTAETAPVVEEEEQVIDYSVGYEAPPQPVVKGAVVHLENVDLTFQTPYDTIVIRGVTGDMMLPQGLFVASKGGKVDFSSAGEPGASCELGAYNFVTKTFRFEAADSKLSYPARTDSVVSGIFKMGSHKYKDAGDKDYPRFMSYKSNIPVKGLADNIKYHGGLSLAGKRIYSSSVDEGFSRIEVQQNGETKIRAVSNRFQLGDSIISSQYTSISIYQEQDSIYHPGAILKYNNAQHKLRITKAEGYRFAPFVDTYHKVDIIADALVWDMQTSNIVFEITNARSHIPATFESQEFFSEKKYTLTQGIYRFQPLGIVVNYSDTKKKKGFYASDLSAEYKIELASVKGAMMTLMKQGYIDYNTRTGYIKVKEKARHYVMSRRDKKDYDNITFVSLSPTGGNATLDLTTNDLKVIGVEVVNISDSLDVDFLPDSSTITIQKNRDFKFNGKIKTAQFLFVGTDFKFNYDSFFVRMDNIDEIQLSVKENKDSLTKSEGKQRALGNELRYSSGTLYINKPDNKSSRKKFAEYPIFDATTGASVFFNKKSIAKGSYDTTVKFEIPPFVVDSLASEDPAQIGFNGTFKSGDIFPPFEEKLVVMPDYSLGFVHQVPTTGYQLYKGKGTYYNEIKLDNQGIRGKGRIVYLNTTLYSDDFVFFKDSVLTNGTNMETKIGPCSLLSDTISYPDIYGTNYRLKWLVKSDSMLISNTNQPFQLYKASAYMQGTLVNSERGMHGLGVVFTRGSSAESQKFHFEAKQFGARNTLFAIKSNDPEKPALRATDVDMRFDLDSNIAYFKPEVEGFASTEFPYGQYKTSIDKGKWDLNKKKVYFTKPSDVDISKSYFYSIRPDQDSLVFTATDAVYELEYLTLNINGIPYINIGDSRVYPDSGRVVVEEKAVIQTLYNANYVCDSVNQFHHHHKGELNILGRNRLNGKTTYQYVNLGDDTLSIQFSSFKYLEGEKRKDGYYTQGLGVVTKEDQLHIGPKILYRGKVYMHSKKKDLSFDGFVKLDLAGALQYSDWLQYKNNGETNQVNIDLKNAVSADGKPLVSGLCLENASKNLYTTFVSLKKSDDDQMILPVNGQLVYDADSNEFAIGDTLKLIGQSLKGNFVSYNDDKSTLKYGGLFNFINETPSVIPFMAGEGHADLKLNDYQTQFVLNLEFKGASAQMEIVGKHLKELSAFLPQPELDQSEAAYEKSKQKEDLLYRSIAEKIDNDGVEKFKLKKGMGPTSIMLASADFTKGLCIQHVEMKWSEEYKSFYSVGKLQVSNIMKNEINREIPGYVELRKTVNGDVINILLEPSYGNWYFFTYEDNRLAMTGSSGDVKSKLAAKSKGEMADRTKFFFVHAEDMEKNQFQVGFKERYHAVDLDEKPKEDTLVAPQQDTLQVNDSLNTGQNSDIQAKPVEEKVKKDVTSDVNDEFNSKDNYDQYKVDETDTNYEQEQQKKKKKEFSEAEREQQKRDRDALREMLK